MKAHICVSDEGGFAIPGYQKLCGVPPFGRKHMLLQDLHDGRQFPEILQSGGRDNHIDKVPQIHQGVTKFTCGCPGLPL